MRSCCLDPGLAYPSARFEISFPAIPMATGLVLLLRLINFKLKLNSG